MFHRTGTRRSKQENFSLAVLLASAAGIVNVTGLLSLGVLTTNVTGHMAGWVAAAVDRQDFMPWAYLGWMLLFIAGAFTSSLITVLGNRFFPRFRFTFPLLLEMMILGYVGYAGLEDTRTSMFIDAGLLLFAMGIQNALVTMVSGAVIRTTHLTGLFTDIGIELGEWMYAKDRLQKTSILIKLSLHFGIVASFGLGGVVAAFLFHPLGSATFYLAVLLLFLSAVYDATLLWYLRLRRRVLKRGKH